MCVSEFINYTLKGRKFSSVGRITNARELNRPVILIFILFLGLRHQSRLPDLNAVFGHFPMPAEHFCVAMVPDRTNHTPPVVSCSVT
jgi:hypothetical protein